MLKTMQDTPKRLVIRLAQNTLSVSTVNADATVDFLPYVVRSGISMAANMREAFKNEAILQKTYDKTVVMVESPVLMVPADLYEEDDTERMYAHAYSDTRTSAVMTNVLPDLSAVALFAINKDLKYMHYLLNDKQYRTYVMLLNTTLNNRGLNN